MNKHLRSAHERDKRRKPYLISPLSETDANIIYELIVALKKVGADDLKAIIEDWKFLKDGDIYDSLLQWNIDHPEGYEDEEGNEDGRKFINFENELMEAALIKTVTKFDHYSYNKNLMEYRIVLNKDFPDNSLLNNVYFTYPTDAEREKKIKMLKKILSKKIKILG